MTRYKVTYGVPLRRYVNKHGLQEKMQSIISLLADDAQQVIDWAEAEARRRKSEDPDGGESATGRIVFNLIAEEAAVRLVKYNQSRGWLTTKSQVTQLTGRKGEMPVLFQEAGVRHPQEARNLRHNIFHQSFVALVSHLFPGVSTSVPTTGEGLTPDLMITHDDPHWTLCVEYKGYRSVALLSESEVLKAMRYQEAYGSAWLVTTTMKTVRSLYGSQLSSEELIEKGIIRLERIAKRKAFTEEQREIRGIAKKGIKQLEKVRGINIRCRVVSAEELIESCLQAKPLKALAITTGLELADMLEKAGLVEQSTQVRRIMKVPTNLLYSDSVTSLRLTS